MNKSITNIIVNKSVNNKVVIIVEQCNSEKKNNGYK